MLHTTKLLHPHDSYPYYVIFKPGEFENPICVLSEHKMIDFAQTLLNVLPLEKLDLSDKISNVQPMRDDVTIINQTWELAKIIANQNGYIISDNLKVTCVQNPDTNPKVLVAWNKACAAQQFLTNTDPMDLYYVLDEMLEEGL